MHGRWDVDRIESSVARDVPDVYFMLPDQGPRHPATTGWIELKQIPKWGFQKYRVTMVPHFTAGQKKWLREHWEAKANCWLLLHVRMTNEYLFFRGCDAPVVGDATQGTLYDKAFAVFKGLPTASTIRGILESKGRQL